VDKAFSRVVQLFSHLAKMQDFYSLVSGHVGFGCPAKRGSHDVFQHRHAAKGLNYLKGPADPLLANLPGEQTIHFLAPEMKRP
jgi:hypothetical protein